MRTAPNTPWAWNASPPLLQYFPPKYSVCAHINIQNSISIVLFKPEMNTVRRYERNYGSLSAPRRIREAGAFPTRTADYETVVGSRSWTAPIRQTLLRRKCTPARVGVFCQGSQDLRQRQDSKTMSLSKTGL